MEIHVHQTALLTARSEQQVLAASEVAQVLSDIQDLPSSDLIEQVPASLCERLGVHRSMISSVRSAVWLPRVLCINSDSTPENRAFTSYVRGASIPLSRAPLETEIARRRAATICRRAADDRRTFKEIVLIANTSAYVVAPIVLRRRVIGFLHADRPVGRATIDETDLERVGILGSCLSPVIERSLLAERLHVESRRLAELFDDASLEIREGPVEPWNRVDVHGINSTSTSTPMPEHLNRPDGSLTSREREVLEFLRTGATNAQIAAGLGVSEGTVKSHVRQLFRKLGVTTRAAAVAKTIRADDKPRGR
jgi:DNA-binding CsgD family transcriptional regulator